MSSTEAFKNLSQRQPWLANPEWFDKLLVITFQYLSRVNIADTLLVVEFGPLAVESI